MMVEHPHIILVIKRRQICLFGNLSLSPDAHDPEEHLEVKDDDHPDQVCDDLPLGEGRRVEASQHNPRKLGARQTSACQVSTLSSITIIVIFLINLSNHGD